MQTLLSNLSRRKNQLLMLLVTLMTSFWTADAATPTMNQSYEATDFQFAAWNNVAIPASYFLSNATEIQVTVKGAVYVAFQVNNTDYKVYAWNDANAAGITYTLDANSRAAALAGTLKVRVNTNDATLYILNKDANYQEPGSGGGSGGGNTGGGTSSKTLAEKIAAREQLTNLPTVYFTVPDAEGKDINAVVYKDRQNNIADYHQTTIQVVDNGQDGTNRPLGNFTEAGLEIKVRGNSTAEMDKRPYRLRFYKDEKDAAGNVTATHKHDMLGYGYNKRNWTILNNMRDGSLMQNAITYYIGQAVGMPFCPGYKFVDLVINGEYRGNYMLSDHVELGKNRIDINEDTGWFVESTRNDMVEEPYFNAAALYVLIKKPEAKTDEGTAAIKAEIQQYFVNNNNNLFGIWANGCDDETFCDPKKGWRSVFDEETLIKLYIGVNLTGDSDGMMQVKMYRETDGKMQFGPLWDKDLAFGIQDDGKTLAEGNGMDFGAPTFGNYVKKIMKTDPVFVKRVHDKLHEVINNGYVNNIIAEIDKLEAMLLESKTLEYNNTGWKAVSVDGYPTAVERLRTYIKDHTKWFVDLMDERYVSMGGDNIQVPAGGDDTPTVNNDALQEVSTGVYKFVGSAATCKQGSVITITTTSASTILSNYITEGTTWNTTKSITLTAADVTALAANGYTFYMKASGGEVKAVNVKEPVENQGAEMNKEMTTTYTNTAFIVPSTQFNASATSIKVTIDWGNTNGAWASIGFSNNAWDNDVQIGWTTNRYTEFTITNAQDIADVAASGMAVNYGNSARTVTVTVVNYGLSSGSTTTQHTLALTTSAGGTVSGAGTYDEGTVVLIKAIANSGYTFVKWSDDNTNPVRSVALSGNISLTATFQLESEAPVVRKQLTDVPTIYIDTTGDITSDWNDANTNTVTLTIFDSENKLNQGPEFTTTAVQIQYQGSDNAGSKNSYRLKFGSKTKLLSSGKFKQWVLASNDDDPSMINNALTKELGDALGMPFTPGYQFVDLYVNNEYQGTYQVTDRIKAESGRALVSGGNKDNDWHVQFDAPSEIKENDNSVYVQNTDATPYIVIKNPDPDDLTAEEITALKQAMSDWFTGTNSGVNFFDNVADYVDKNQLVSWYIGMEILCSYKGLSSIEAYRSVTAADQKLHMGPFWDSEKAFGNAPKHPINMTDLETEDSYQGLITEYSDYKVMRKWLKKLWRQKWFAEGVIAKWNTLYGENKSTDLQNLLKTKATAIAGTLAQTQVKNAEKWDNSLGSYTSYSAAVGAVSTYLDSRFPYLDAKFNELYEIAVADLGDVNVDGVVNRQDVTDLGKYIIKNYTGKFSKTAADVNEDSKISLADLAALIKKLEDK